MAAHEQKGGDAPKHVSGQANEPTSQLPHELPAEKLAEEIGANLSDGLTSQEAKQRLEKFGQNELDNGPGVSPVKILIRQVANAMTLVSPYAHFMCTT